MSFPSLAFVSFFVVVYGGYWSLRGRSRKLFLLVLSYFFYALWDPRFVSLLILCTLTDFFAGARIGGTPSIRRRRAFLMLSLGVNIGVLSLFKYFNFFTSSLVALLASVGLTVSAPVLQLGLPVGLSFYTFRSLSYTIDIFRGTLRPTPSLLDYAVFVAFFPLLGAGPIVRARQFLPQLARPRPFALADLDAGFSRFVLGLFKKAFIADTLGQYLVDPVFARPGSYAAWVLWVGMLGYSVQIYADFSGYSSMAIGVSRALGFKIAENFSFPYLARNVSEFWRRWHISMTSWFRDYLWWSIGRSIPFAASWRWSGAMIAIFLVSGLWHGAGWTFVAWGGLHGLYIALHQRWRYWRETLPPWPRSLRPVWTSLGAILTSLLVMLAWVLFRSADFGTAWTFLRGMSGFAGSEALRAPVVVAVAFTAFGADHLGGWVLERRAGLSSRIRAPLRGVACASLLVFLWHGLPEHANPFIYFRF